MGSGRRPTDMLHFPKRRASAGGAGSEQEIACAEAPGRRRADLEVRHAVAVEVAADDAAADSAAIAGRRARPPKTNAWLPARSRPASIWRRSMWSMPRLEVGDAVAVGADAGLAGVRKRKKSAPGRRSARRVRCRRSGCRCRRCRSAGRWPRRRPGGRCRARRAGSRRRRRPTESRCRCRRRAGRRRRRREPVGAAAAGDAVGAAEAVDDVGEAGGDHPVGAGGAADQRRARASALSPNQTW